MQPSPETLAAHAECVRRDARSLSVDPTTAEDAVQDAWLGALTRSDAPQRSSAGWLARVAERLGLRELRGSRRRQRRERAHARSEVQRDPPLERLEREELVRAVSAAVLSLDEPLRSTVLALDYEGLDAATLARQEGVTRAVIHGRRRRALAALRGRLDADDPARQRGWRAGLVLLAGEPPATPFARALPLALPTAAAALLGAVWVVASDDVPRAGAESAAPILQTVEAQHGPADPPQGSTLAAERETIAVAPRAQTGDLVLHVTRARDGTPAAGRTVLLRALGEPFATRQLFARADQQGRASFRAVAPGSVSASTDLGGHVEASVVAGETTELELVLPLGLRVSGRVVDPGGAPVANAAVWVSQGYGQRGLGSVVARSAGDGRFLLEDVQPGRYIAARAAGFGPSLSELLARDAGNVDLELALSPLGGALVCLVSDPSGAPLPRARVRVDDSSTAQFRADGRMAWFHGFQEQRTDADGRCSFEGLVPGHVRLRVLARDAALHDTHVRIDSGTRSSYEARLAPGAAVFGSCTTPDGLPAAGLTVRPAGELDASGFDPVTRTDEAGRFRLTNLRAGHIQIKASAQDQGVARAELELEPGGSLEWSPQLATGHVLTGVVSEAGAPLAGAQVSARRMDREAWFGSSVSDADGRYTVLDCPAGARLHVRLKRALTGGVPRLILDDVDPLAGELDFDLTRIAAASVTLRGVVVDASGLARAGNVYAARDPERSGMGTPGHPLDPASGAFSIEHLQAGRYLVTAYLEGLPARTIAEFDCEASETLDLGRISLPRPGTLCVSNYAGVSSLQLTPVDDPWNPARSWSPSEVAELEIWPGAWTLSSVGAAIADFETAFEIRPGELTRVELDPRPGTSIEVRLLRPGLDPGQLDVYFLDPAGESVQPALSATEEGARAYRRLARGPWRLVVDGAGGERLERELEATGEFVSILVELP